MVIVRSEWGQRGVSVSLLYLLLCRARRRRPVAGCDIRRCVDWPPRPALRSPAADRTNWQRSTSGHCPRLPPAVLQAASSTRSQHSFTSIRGLQVLLRCCYQWAPLCSWLIGGCFLITCTIYKCTDYSASHKIYKHEAWSMWGKHEDNLFWSVSVIPIMYVNK